MPRITAQKVNHSYSSRSSGNGTITQTYHESYRVPWSTYDDGTPNPYARRTDTPQFVYQAKDPDSPSDFLVGGLPYMHVLKTLPEDYDPPSENPPPAMPPPEGKADYFCTSYDASLVHDPNTSATYWQFDYTYTTDFGLFKNDGDPIALDPTEMAARVSINFDQEWEMVDDAVYLGLGMPQADQTGGFVPQSADQPPWLDGYIGPVVNTALQQRDVNRPTSIMEIGVTRLLADASVVKDWNDQLYTINTNTFRIHDGKRGDFNREFFEGELFFSRMVYGQKYWFNGEQYVEVSLFFRVASHKNKFHNRRYDHRHHEPEQGNMCYCVANVNYGPHGSGTENLHTQQDITDLVNELGSTLPDYASLSGVQVPLTVNLKDKFNNPLKVATGGEFKLNGWGQPVNYRNHTAGWNDIQNWYTIWDIYRGTVFDFGMDQTDPNPPTSIKEPPQPAEF